MQENNRGRERERHTHTHTHTREKPRRSFLFNITQQEKSTRAPQRTDESTTSVAGRKDRHYSRRKDSRRQENHHKQKENTHTTPKKRQERKQFQSLKIFLFFGIFLKKNGAAEGVGADREKWKKRDAAAVCCGSW